MSDAMTNWSNFFPHKEEIEYEVRHKLSELIKENIDVASARGVNNHFISGLELANSIVLGFDPYKNNHNTQPSLF
jgi:L-lactate utilization protein LutB